MLKNSEAVTYETNSQTLPIFGQFRIVYKRQEIWREDLILLHI